jgi:hypothetical protein
MRPAAIRLPIVLAAASIAAAVAHATPAAARPAAGPAAAAPFADACPAQLPVTQTISEPIAGWTRLDQQGSAPFVRIAFFPGPPGDTPLIVPTIEFRGAAGLHDGWDLPPRQGGYWMTCAYANTKATLARPLPAGIDFCQADYDKRFLTLVVRRWSCGLRRTMLPPRHGSRPPHQRGP